MTAYFDYRFRIILIGDHAAGKSSLVESYVTGNFKEPSIPTIGADFFTKLVQLDGGPCVKLEIWDTAGQEKFRAITQSYYRDSVGIVLVYDICKRDTYEHLWKWMMEARTYIDPHAPVFVLVGCKLDLAEEDDDRREVPEEEAITLGQGYGMFTFETSAKSATNVEAPFVRLAQEILNRVESGEYNVEGDWDAIQVGSTISPPEVVIEKITGERKEKSRCCSYF